MINIFEVMKNTSQTSRCNLIIQILRNNRQSGSVFQMALDIEIENVLKS